MHYHRASVGLAFVFAACSSSSSPSGPGAAPDAPTASVTPDAPTGTSGSDPTVIATDLTEPTGIAVDGTNVYFGCHDNEGTGGGGVFKIAIGGGSVTMLTGDDAEHGIAVDESYVYYMSGGALKRVAKAGGDPQMVVGNEAGISEADVEGDDAFFVHDGFIYFLGSDGTSGGVARAPVAGGNVQVLVPDLVDGHTAAFVLVGADDSGVVWVNLDTTDLDHLPVMVAGLDGSSPTPVTIRDSAKAYASDRLVGGAIYWTEQDGSGADTSSVHRMVLGSGADSPLGSFQFPNTSYLTTDGSALYVAADSGGEAGIYRVASGAGTRLHADDVLSPGEEGSPRNLISDAGHLYWFSGGFIEKQAELHVMAR